MAVAGGTGWAAGGGAGTASRGNTGAASRCGIGAGTGAGAAAAGVAPGRSTHSTTTLRTAITTIADSITYTNDPLGVTRGNGTSIARGCIVSGPALSRWRRRVEQRLGVGPSSRA